MNSKAPYKDFEVDIDKGIDMFSNMSKCLDKKWECDANKRCNEECDECEYMYGCGNTGQIQNLLENVQEWLTELKKYKQMEEQCRLIKLPCKIGDTVYEITGATTRGYDWKYLTYEKAYVHGTVFNLDRLYDIGKTVFLTKSEAEAKLKEWSGAE